MLWNIHQSRFSRGFNTVITDNLAVEVGFERSVESRQDEAYLLWGHLAARSRCGSGRGHRRRREAPERSLDCFPPARSPIA